MKEINLFNYDKNHLTYIDLFSGAGGMSLGFNKEGFTNLFSIDIEKSFCETYKFNFPKHYLIQKDISKLTDKEILDLVGTNEVDVVIGGPPCQGFSIAGNIGRKFIDDPRNRLFKEFVRVVSIVKPKYFVMENVARLFTHNKNKTRQEIIEDFEKIGYKVDVKILNSADYGVPQIRKRVIFIGSRVRDMIKFPEKKFNENEYRTIKEAIDDLPELYSGEMSDIPNHNAMNHTQQMLEKMKFVKNGGDRNDIPKELRPKTGDARKYIRYDSKKPSITITGDMRKVFHYSQNRALTVRELARIQSFPDTFVFKGNSISTQQQVGNAVPPLMAQALAKCIKDMLKQDSVKTSNFTYEYPKVNYIGNKEKLASWICDNIPKDANSIFDAFSGGASVSYEAKKRGLNVISNDILKINFYLAKSLIENKDIRLTNKDIDIIFSGKPFKGFMTKYYSEVFFFENECMELDLYRKNIDKLDSDYKKAIAFALLRRAMIRKMPYSRFNLNWEKIKQLRDEEYSYKKYKRRRAYHNQSFKEHFLANLDEYNNAIFDNKKDNIAYNDDIFNLLSKIKADVIYLDPPYTGTMNNYFGFYGLIDEYIEQKKLKPFENNFIDKKTSLGLFDKLFSKLSKFKYWILSYNNNSYPSKEDLIQIISKYSNKDDINIIEKPHNYKVTGKEKKNKNTEYLFIIKNNLINKRKIMSTQTYEEYWKLTLEYTNIHSDKFLGTLNIIVNCINDGCNYKQLQEKVYQQYPKKDMGSVRKSINQFVKLGFVNSLTSYNIETIDFLNAQTQRKRNSIFSKVVYKYSKFNASITNTHNWNQINFLIKTLEEVGTLSKENIIGLMLVDIPSITKGYLMQKEVDAYTSYAQYIGFVNRKYNQIAYLTNLLNKLDDIIFVNNILYFKNDAENIFGEDLKIITKKRDPYLHRLYKKQLKDECEEIYGNPMCVLEKLSYPVLIASHIKPFIESNEDEAYDPNNGLLLSRTIDSLFDLKYISFNDDGTILFSKRISKDVKEFWKNYKLEENILNEKRKNYLAYHRDLLNEIDNQVMVMNF